MNFEQPPPPLSQWRISALFHPGRFSSGRRQLLIRFFCNLFLFPILSLPPWLPCLIAQSIKKAIKHHAGNMYNPSNKAWIKYANSNNGMLISVPFRLHYWFCRDKRDPLPLRNTSQGLIWCERIFFHATTFYRNKESARNLVLFLLLTPEATQTHKGTNCFMEISRGMKRTQMSIMKWIICRADLTQNIRLLYLWLSETLVLSPKL